VKFNSSSVRVIVMIDPLVSHGIYTQMAILSLMEITIPMMTISSLLIVFYWLELMKHVTAKHGLFIKKFRIPFYLLSAFAMIIQIIKISLGTVGVASFEMALFSGRYFIFFLVRFLTNHFSHFSYCN